MPPLSHRTVHSPSRRRFLGYGASAGVLLGTGAWTASTADALTRGHDHPFTLGVASGDPHPDGVVLWTRLAPDPLHPNGHGGMSSRPVRVHYEVAADETFRRVVRRSSVVATAELAHSVHPEITGLEPDRHYWYRFRVGDHISEVGRTKTAPAAAALPHALRFAVASCQRWEHGYFTAFDHLAAEELDLVIHLGDYIYETSPAENERGVDLPSGFAHEAASLHRYRQQYALYKSEKPLQDAHAAFPWIHTFDDHEVENNWAADISEVDTGADQDPHVFRKRRAAAFRAMYEHLPLRHQQLPDGPNILMHRRLRYGRLADFTMVDTRQYRDDQCGSTDSSANRPERFHGNRTLLGSRQRRWLTDGFASSTARWQIIGNQAPMGQTDIDPTRKRTEVYLDAWDGYVADRNRILAEADRRGVRNLVVATGDRHAAMVMDLKPDYRDPDSPVVGTEFVGTSISSAAEDEEPDGADVDALGKQMLRSNPHLSFYNSQRGYQRTTVTPDQLRTDVRVLPYVTRRGAPIKTRASFVVRDQIPGVGRV